MAFLACNLPRRFSRASGVRVCRKGGEASVSLHVHSLSSSLFPLFPAHLFIFTKKSLQFLCSHERLFLLLEALLGRGVYCCNLCRSRSLFQKGEGTWRRPRPLLLTLADPRASLCHPRPKSPFPHSAAHSQEATFLEEDHTCAYSSFGGEVSQETRESSVPQSF